MSADNRLCIMEWHGNWYGWHGSCSTNYFEPGSYHNYFESKKQALEWARKEAEQTVVLEGGLTEIGIEEQKLGLIDHIKDASERLGNLYRWNTQFPVNHDLNFK